MSATIQRGIVQFERVKDLPYPLPLLILESRGSGMGEAAVAIPRDTHSHFCYKTQPTLHRLPLAYP
jgi:hypothetical protein